jgi:propanol-preferring alcohol dehydrogenase
MAFRLKNFVADAISFVANRKGATIMCIACPPAGEVLFGSDPNTFVFKNLHVIGSCIGTMQDTASCLNYAKRGLLKGIGEVRGKSQWAESVQQLRRGEVAGRIVIDFNKD